jgi:hypothetical protein
MDKRARNKIKIRLSLERMEALLSICEEMLLLYKPENETEQLMYAYLKEFYATLYQKGRQYQSRYTLHMTATEAIAFRQMWESLGIKNNKYAGILIKSIISQLDSYKELLLHV